MVKPGVPDPVDRARLTKMGKEIGEEALREYAALFRALLDGRIERIGRAVPGRTADGLRAVLDLSVGSEMLGARRLAALSAEAAVLLHGGRPVGPGLLTDLRIEAAAVTDALRQALD